MGQYHKLINLTKKEYVNPYDIGLGAKHHEGIGFDGSMGDVIYLLTIAQGNDQRGGGDASGHNYIGRWRGDQIAVVGDYYTDKDDDERFKDLYFVDDKKDWENISASVRVMLSKVIDDLKFHKEIFKVKNLDGTVEEDIHWRRCSNEEYKNYKKEKLQPDNVFQIKELKGKEVDNFFKSIKQ